jgi:hypothetical protein
MLKFKKSFPILAGAVLATGLFGTAAHAGTFTFSGSGTSSDGDISGTAVITTGAGTIGVSLTSNTFASSQGQALSDISFVLSDAPGTLGTFTQSGQLANVTPGPPSTITDISGSPTHWAGSNPSDSIIVLATAGPGAPGGQPFDMIIPGINSPVTGGFDNFIPYIHGTGTFSLVAPGVTAATTVSNVILSFGTSGANEHTIAIPAPLLGHGPLVLLAVGGLLLGAKLFGRSKKHRGTAIPYAAA